LVSPEQIRQILGDDVFRKLTFRADSADILRWHNASDITDRVVESSSLFSALGMQLEVSDITEARGGELILDLNEPCDPSLHRRYDLLVDSGTLEHCFNIGQAAKNMACMAALGGYIWHGNPLNMLNHGFYNLNPTWYADFYTENGFELLYLKAASGSRLSPKIYDVPAYKRFGGVPEDTCLDCIVKKQEEKPLVWPVQTKYKNNPTLKSQGTGHA
jgi:hypothetical protein